MSTCHKYPTKAQAIEGFCKDFSELCSVSDGVKSVPSDVEKSILFDTDTTNDENHCDGGFDLACPTACGNSETTVKATYRVVADAFGGGEECPYHDGFEMEITCPATDPCPADCEGSWGGWSACPTCGTTSSSHTQTRTWNTSSTLPSGYYYSPACPTTDTRNCPAKDPCPSSSGFENTLDNIVKPISIITNPVKSCTIM